MDYMNFKVARQELKWIKNTLTKEIDTTVKAAFGAEMSTVENNMLQLKIDNLQSIVDKIDYKLEKTNK